jgi:V8-like Glu-specific endopeptidase
MKVRRRWPVVATALWLAGGSAAVAQMSPVTSREYPYPIDSGKVQNQVPGGIGDAASLVYWNEVRVHGSPWLRLKFDEAVLSGVPGGPDGSYLVITSLLDNATQRLNAVSIQDWSNTSAYFNGDAVRIELFAYPGSGLNRIRMSTVTGGTFEQGAGQGAPDTICGNVDDRTLSSYPANARILPMGCTGWLITNGTCANRFLTAGHCFLTPPIPTSAVVQFNVPLSTAGGGLVNPPPEHQYPVNMASLQAVQTVIGNDWAQFFTNANSNTGLHAREAQGGAAYSIANAPAVAGQTLRITGYGTTHPNDPVMNGGLPLTHNQVQKTHTGAYTLIAGTRIEYAVDTTGGNSGSPVVNGTSPSNVSFGIHTNAGCNTGGGANSGTAIQNAGLQAALASPLGPCAPYTAPTCLESLFASNNGGSAGGAVYFNVQVAGTADLEVSHILQNTGAVGASFNVAIYLTPTTHVGKELIPGQWTLAATGSGASEAENTPSLVALSNRFTLEAGRSYGVAIVSNGLGHEYTDGTGANEVYNNANLIMTFGRAGNAAFTAPLITGERVWNGRFCYFARPVTSSQCLDTIFAQNNEGSLGGTIFFNANVSAARSLFVPGLKLNAGSLAPPGTAFTVQMFTKAGSFAGFEENPGAWTLRATGSGVTAPINSETNVELDSVVTLNAGSNNAVALVMSAAANHTYTNGTGGNQNYTNGTLTIQTGSATNGAFSGGVNSPRVFNGALCYLADSSGCSNTVDEQAPPNPLLGGFNSNDAGGGVSTQQIADNFSVASNSTINGVRLWAVYTGSTFVPPTQSFTVNIFADAAGNPGAAPIYTANVPGVAVFDTGIVQSGFSPSRPLYRYDLNLPNFAATAGTTYWLSALGTTDSHTWCWQFVTNPVGGTLRFRSGPAGAWTSSASSVAFELCGTASCYANCDGVGGLTANDFVCFLTAYNNGLPYANCDGVGGLTANDFVCFVTAYNAGCP